MRYLLNKVAITLGFFASGLFLIAEVHAWWVLAPNGVLCDNPDFGVMWHMDSMLPMQFRLMSYRAGAGEIRDSGFWLPSSALVILTFGIGLHYLELALERWNRNRPKCPGITH